MKYISLVILTFGSTAFAGYEGKFSCPNRASLPDNVYSINMTSLSGLDSKVPFVVAERYYRESGSVADSPAKKSVLSGFAAISENEKDTVLMVGALRLEIVDNGIKGCKKLN